MVCLRDDLCFFFQAEDGIRDLTVTGVQTCALPISGFVYDSGQYEAALDRVLTLVDYKSFRELQRARRAEHRWLGIGFSSFVETAGVGPSKTTHIIGWESGGVRVEPAGKGTGVTGASPHGQGLETAFPPINAV